MPERSAKTVTPTMVAIGEVYVDKNRRVTLQEVTNQLSSGKASVPDFSRKTRYGQGKC